MSSMRRISRALLNTAAYGLPALALAAAPAVAQSSKEPVKLGTMVLTAAGFEQLLKDAPASVSVITGEELQKAQVTNLADALKGVQGVNFTGTANESDIFIRGMSGSYTLIMVDGKRQSTRDTRTNGNAGYEHRFIPPVSAIERIEVVRGPMSSLYGSDAMGGVVNIITKKVSDVWGGEISIDATKNADDRFGNKSQAQFYLNGPLVEDKLGLQIWGRSLSEKADDIAVTDGKQAADEEALNARLTWTPTDAQDILFELGKTDVKTTPAANTSYGLHDRVNAALTHIGRWDFGTSEISLSHEKTDRDSHKYSNGNWALEPRSPEITNTVLDAKLTSERGDHKLTYGGQFFRAVLNDQNPGTGSTVQNDFTVDQKALFIEDEWKLRDDLALTFGLRYNDHSEYKGEFTPRVYAVWDATEDLTIKGGISTGFRAPDVRSIAPGYLYTTGGSTCAYNEEKIGGVYTSRTPSCGVILADENLRPEKTLNVELAMMYDTGASQFGATIFRTKFTDKIDNYNTGDAHPSATYEIKDRNGNGTGTYASYLTWKNRNINNAVIQGIELTYDAALTDSLQLRANYTYTHSEQKDGDYAGWALNRTPEHVASLRLDWDTPTEGLSLWTAANYHGSEVSAGTRLGSLSKKTYRGTPLKIASDGDTVLATKMGGYTTVDLGGSYAINDNIDMNFALYNAFDTEVTAAESNAVVDGRRVWLGLTHHF